MILGEYEARAVDVALPSAEGQLLDWERYESLRDPGEGAAAGVLADYRNGGLA